MKRLIIVLVLGLAPLLTSGACATRLAPGVLPAREGTPPPAEVTIVWVGTGACEQFVRGSWVRRPQFDYEFTVEQRRYRDHWESTKHLLRRHPGYDGSAGPREQTLYFHLAFGAVTDAAVPVRVTSTLGAGQGATDREFRRASVVFHPEVSSFAPFDTYRIEQRYGYESGALEETVSLDKGAAPWVRNQERATLFAAHAYVGPPTTR